MTKNQVRAVKADTSPFDGNGVVVAVLDTGIDPAHPAFAGVELARRNFTSEADDDLHALEGYKPGARAPDVQASVSTEGRRGSARRSSA